MRKYIPRKRNLFLIGGSIIALLFSYLIDPNGGAMTIVFLQQISLPIVAVWFAYVARHALFDYIDMEDLYIKAKESAVGSAVTFLGLCVLMYGLLGLFGTSARAQDVTTYVPTKAAIYLPIVKTELDRMWSDHPKEFLYPV